jgi:hypothetical protein
MFIDDTVLLTGILFVYCYIVVIGGKIVLGLKSELFYIEKVDDCVFIYWASYDY